MLSATFHAAIIGAIILFAMLTDTSDQPAPHVLELVAGAGDNYGATEAPALGVPDGVKLDLPPMPTPKAEPAPAPEPTPAVAVEPVQPEPTPITPAPAPPPTPPKATVVPKKAPPTFKQIIQRKVWASEWRAKQQIKKERAEEAKRLKKEEFDRLQREKAAAATKARRSGTTHVSHIDAQGIADGVIGGSTANKTGGAGGRAMTASGALLDQYYAMLKERIRNAIDKPPGISDQLEVSIAFHIAADGHLYGARVSHSSGSTEWDQAVLTAFGQVSMPEHPEHRDDFLELTFRTKDED